MGELRKDVPSSGLFSSERALVIYGGFLGPLGSVTRMHFDSEDNIITCIFGRKLFVVTPPYVEHLLDYGAREVPLDDPWNPDVEQMARRHPLFAKCSRHVHAFVLDAGDIFVQPKGW